MSAHDRLHVDPSPQRNLYGVGQYSCQYHANITLSPITTIYLFAIRFISRSNHCHWKCIVFEHQALQLFGLKLHKYKLFLPT